MDKTYNHRDWEEKIYQYWEKSGAFTAKIDKDKPPFTIILPLPNANDPMHMGHALFTVEDIMVRYHRMFGDPTLWLPGGDHAGIETQFVFEKKLKTEGKSRFDFDRDTLYQMIWDFADKNKNVNKDQMKKLGFSMDWTRYHYSLEPEIVDRVLKTFEKLYRDNLIYRGERIVNFCTRCGTAFSDLEVVYKEREDFLYHLDYRVIKIATTRPETIFADVAIAVNPKDKRYKNLVGKKATIPLINLEIPIITDEAIDIKFGTGALKVTPGHDPLDYDIGQKNNLEVINLLTRQGQLDNIDRIPPELRGLYVNQAREKTVELLKAKGKLVKTEPLTHTVGTCYRCGTVIEPITMPQWFVKTKTLAKPAINAVKNGTTKIFPKKRFEKMFFDWMENIKDWNISRQIVWGPRIPIWYCLDCNPNLLINFIDKKGAKISADYKALKNKHLFSDIESGLQSLVAPKDAVYQLSGGKCGKCQGSNLLQETDTFDTWFLSGQWPVNTLKAKPGDFEYFYPTSVLDTLWDILFFWVGRMMMFGFYLTGKTPFGVIHLHARVVDKEGRKMSKSKGNVIDPLLMVDKYGADALRMALTIGVAPGGDISISDEKVMGMRNFANKIWNMGRYVNMIFENTKDVSFQKPDVLDKVDEKMIKDLESFIATYSQKLDSYKFGSAAEDIYEFSWHIFADKYIEESKERARAKDIRTLFTIRRVYLAILKLLHPFMPFVTEAVWQELKNLRKYPDRLLISSPWPEVK